MSLYIASLNSGSNGNCFYIGNETDAILIDAGISCRETEKRLSRLGLSMSIVRAIFISHEHSDHITGVPGISKKYQIPVFITSSTRKYSNIPIEDHLVCSFSCNNAEEVEGLTIKAFRKSHDASDPHSFVITYNGVNVGVFTDIGYSCREVTEHFNQCDAVFLESNYCEDMLEKGRYPEFLKQRIRGERGHLSNDQAIELFKQHRSPKLTHLILSHLSKNNNCPELVERLFNQCAGNTKIIVASRYVETAIYKIESTTPAPFFKKPRPRHTIPSKLQLSLFE